MANTVSSNTDNSSSYRQIVLNEIRTKWDKFSNQELLTLRRRDDLVTQVQAKYCLNREQVERDVDALITETLRLLAVNREESLQELLRQNRNLAFARSPAGLG